jgi:arginase family enzyme
MHHDPQWPRASEWLASGSPLPALTVIGAPLNRSVTPGRCDLGPKAIRDALMRFSTYDFASGRDVRDLPVCDFLDIDPAEIEAMVGSVSGVVCLLGGDNGVTRPGVRGLGVPLDRVGLVTFDAHLDLRHLKDGPMNGNPIRGLLSDGILGTNIIQVGLQSFANSPEYADFGKSEGIIWVTAEQCHRSNFEYLFGPELDDLAKRVDAIAFDLDLDVMDRAFAPGCPGSRPGGLTPWQLRRAARIAGSHPKVRYVDIVELDPELDEGHRTAMAGAACLLEFAIGMLERG